MFDKAYAVSLQPANGGRGGREAAGAKREPGARIGLHMKLISNAEVAVLPLTLRKVMQRRAVFELRFGRLNLTEIAPGIDLQSEVLDQLAAPVSVAADLKIMDERIFHDAPMLRETL